MSGKCAGGAGEWWTTPDGKSSRYMLSPSALTALLEAAGFEDVAIQVRSAPLYYVQFLEARFPIWIKDTRLAQLLLMSKDIF